MNFIQKLSVRNVLRITVPTGILVEVGELTLNIIRKQKGKDSQDTLKEKTVRQTLALLEVKAPTRRRGGAGALAAKDARNGAESPSADPRADAAPLRTLQSLEERRFPQQTGLS